MRVWAIALTAIAAAQTPVREIGFEPGDYRWPTIPGLHGSRLYFRDQARHNRVTLYSTDGKQALNLDTPASPGGLPEVLTVAIDTDGTIAVGWMASGQRTSAGIDYHDAAGKLVRSVDTGLFIPAHLAFAPDHTLWSFGWQRDPQEPRKPDSTDYATVRQYDPDWRLLASALPRSSLAKGSEPGFPYWQRRQIAVSANRIGVLAHPPGRSGTREWLELGFDGKVQGRWTVPFAVDRMAMTADGRVFLESGENEARVVAQLDRGTGTWKKLARPPNGILCGAEGNDLVFAEWIKASLHFRWYRSVD